MPTIPFQHALTNPDVFCVTWELVPGRGAHELQQEDILKMATAAAASGKIHALSITDNPSGNPGLSAEFLCAELARCGIEPVVHFACRDKNRNAIESLLYGLERSGVRNLLVVSGDFPSPAGFYGTARPVFDLDPVQVMQLIARMNSGFAYQEYGRKAHLLPTHFFAGVAVSPFKKTEPELIGQYTKLQKKIAAGAQFAVTQIGFDPRKFHEMILWLKQHEIQIPVLANLFALSYPSAKFIAAGNIPGCVVPPQLLEELSRDHEQPDKGRAARTHRAARFYAIAKGLGYAGVHIGGHKVTHHTVLEIIQRGEELFPSWQDMLSACDYQCGNLFYYYFKPAPPPILNSSLQANRLSLQPYSRSLGYRLCLLMHRIIFAPSSPLYPMLRLCAQHLDRSAFARRLVSHLEHIIKTIIFRCADCGDCSLPDTAYLCPLSGCPKSQRNGPCGGSDNGWCEVYPGEKKCLWVRVYERRSATGTEPDISTTIVPPCNWQLWQTSSWLNYFLGRDHTAQVICRKKTQPKNSAS